MKKLEKGKYYSLKVNHFGRELDYEGEIVYLSEEGFGLRTEEDCDLRFSFKNLKFAKEKDKLKEDPTIVVRKRVGSEGLKETEGPVGL